MREHVSSQEAVGAPKTVPATTRLVQLTDELDPVLREADELGRAVHGVEAVSDAKDEEGRQVQLVAVATLEVQHDGGPDDAMCVEAHEEKVGSSAVRAAHDENLGCMLSVARQSMQSWTSDQL